MITSSEIVVNVAVVDKVVRAWIRRSWHASTVGDAHVFILQKTPNFCGYSTFLQHENMTVANRRSVPRSTNTSAHHRVNDDDNVDDDLYARDRDDDAVCCN